MLSLRNRHRLTVGLWIVLFVFAVYWARERSLTVSARGVAFGRTLTVSSSEAGLLAEVAVQLHQVVDRGQRVARLDPSDLMLEQRIVAAALDAERFIAAQEADVATAAE